MTRERREWRRHAAALVVILGTASPVGAQDRAFVTAAAEGNATNEKEDDKGTAAPPRELKPPSNGWRRDRFALKKGKSKIEFTGYIQEDFRDFDWEVEGDPSGSKRAPEHELRRLRLGTRVRLGNVLFEAIGDPRRPKTGSRLTNLNAGYEFSKHLTFRAGLFKLPGSKEFQAPTNATDFLDRSMIAVRLVPGRDWGASLAGTVARATYLVGVFKGDGNGSPQRSGTLGAGQVSVDVTPRLQLAGSFSQGRVTAAPIKDSLASTPPKGALGETPSGYTFWRRAYVDGPRRRMSGSLTFSRGPFRVLGEYLEQREARHRQGPDGLDLPEVIGRGWSAQASYVLTGERKATPLEPRRSLFHGGPGAVELVARAETLRFDNAGDQSGPVSAGNRASNIAPAAATAVEVGVNYWASNFAKVQTVAMWERYNDSLIPPTPPRRGPYLTFMARLQFMVP